MWKILGRSGGLDCELIETCAFFNDGTVDSAAVEMLKKVYCRDHQENCARYMIYKGVGREHVPAGLYPNQTHLVPSIIQKALASGGDR